MKPAGLSMDFENVILSHPHDFFRSAVIHALERLVGGLGTGAEAAAPPRPPGDRASSSPPSRRGVRLGHPSGGG